MLSILFTLGAKTECSVAIGGEQKFKPFQAVFGGNYKRLSAIFSKRDYRREPSRQSEASAVMAGEALALM